MINNYPFKNKKQNKCQSYGYDDYIETSIEPFDEDMLDNMSNDVEVEMSRSIHDMRREFKKNYKKLRRYYSEREPSITNYKYEDKYANVRLRGHRATG